MMRLGLALSFFLNMCNCFFYSNVNNLSLKRIIVRVNNAKDYKYASEYYSFLKEQNQLDKSVESNFFKFLKTGGQEAKNQYIDFAKNREHNYRIFEKNYQLISEYNSHNNDCKLEFNKFTDKVDTTYKTDNDEPYSDLMRMKEPINSSFNFFFGKTINKIYKAIKYFKIYQNLPEKFIWDENILSEVKNQGQCGSCWAFSTTSSIESLMRINNYTVDRLSEQQLVDCSKENYGCGGGLMHLALDYVIENKGLISNNEYKYVAQQQSCGTDCFDEGCLVSNHSFIAKNNVIGSNITGYEYIIPKSKIDIMASLQNGPITIALDANSFIFRFYKSGIIDIPSNMSEEINHAVLLTGYDKDENGTYWIIQNSWGKDWGDNGFVKVRARNGDGVLLSQLYGVYPKYK